MPPLPADLRPPPSTIFNRPVLSVRIRIMKTELRESHCQTPQPPHLSPRASCACSTPHSGCRMPEDGFRGGVVLRE
ncbi:hypothetical protein B0H19DRAFT_1154546 [Mycena capillaripes]|nr:hypothetical protein B0H19DRAFT_1154546 [Mycena capillaripes]